ncbi:hypothetical protein TIFTF001_029490 [Ficus carica]|uniref:Uncharacterized protein n=1 Tax=Ficus carica TaxID=3494 RepID=A0AA88DW25_FICCA|nr:hypothetical protein TIFTF001_029490 [Ficus carica]
MFTNDNLHGKIKIKFQVRFGSWFELDWAGRPNHSMTTRHVVLAEQKLTTYVYAVGSIDGLDPRNSLVGLHLF